MDTKHIYCSFQFSTDLSLSKHVQGLQVWWLNKLHSTFPEKRSSPLRQKRYYVSSLKEHKETNKPTTNYVKQAFKMDNKPVNFNIVYIVRHDKAVD